MEMHSLTSSSFIICLWGEMFGSRTILYSEISKLLKFVFFPKLVKIDNFNEKQKQKQTFN